MSNLPPPSHHSRSKPKPNDDPVEDDGSSFAWEFGNDEQTGPSPVTSPRAGSRNNVRPVGGDGQRMVIDGSPRSEQVPTPLEAQPRTPQARRPSPSALLKAGRFGPARANYIRDQLDRALDRWWALGELPPLLLLRDGLLMLEGGGSASESQRTLLLRAALAYDRGVQTALRHQVDAERVALVVAEALVEWETPLEAERLPAILEGDEQVRALLIAELERSRVLLTGEPRRRAQFALEALPQPTSKARKPISPPPAATMVRGRRPLRQIILILLLVALVGFVLWQQRQSTPMGMIAMPAATYALLTLDGDGAANSVALDAFFIDRFEVTNRDYRGCVDEGECAWPLQPNSATRTDYFTNPAFDGYPVVNVTQAMAAGYCAWQEKRLPSAGEWQAAASVSPTTGQFFRFPWGESFEAQRTNSANTGVGDTRVGDTGVGDTGVGDTMVGDTMVVGSFRPAGDSPSGVADMAGNVAEWTTTLLPGSEGKPLAIVKGGSFISNADALTVYAEAPVEVNQALPEVGFRCARSHLLTQR